MKLPKAVWLCALAFTSANSGQVVAAASGISSRQASATVPTGSTCGPSTPGAIVHDDGSVEALVRISSAAGYRMVDKFTPTSYPNSFTDVCFSFATFNANFSTLDFTIVVYADDGTDGGPGTLLGSKPASLTQLPVSPAFPYTAAFQAFNIADLGVNISSGSVYIGAMWDSSTAGFSFARLAMDTSPATALGEGYLKTQTSAWFKTVSVAPTYRSMFIRAVQSVTAGATISKAFAPASVAAQTTSTLTLTLENPTTSAATLTADLTDTFPAGLVVAPTPNAVTSCTDGVVTAAAGAGSVMLASGAAIPAGGTCTLTVDVTAAAAGNYTNTIDAGALQTSAGGNTTAATAILTVTAGLGAPLVQKAFLPSTVAPAAFSMLTVTLGNGNATPATLSAALTDTFPAGVVLANAANPNPTSTCPNAQVSVNNGSLTLGTGAQIPANGSCAFSVNVKSATGGVYVNTIPLGAMQTDQGSNVEAANATLTVQAAPTLLKVFTPASIQAESTSTLTLTLGNANPAPAILSADLTDTFPSGLVTATTPNVATTCSGGPGVTTTSGSVALGAGAAIPANGSCTVKVDVTAGTTGSYVNSIPGGALQTNYGINPIAVSATLTVTLPNNPPAATVTPTTLVFTVAADATQTQQLNIADATGSDPLAYSIAAREAANRPRLFAHATYSKLGRADIDAVGNRPAPTLSAANGRISRHRPTTPWAPRAADGSAVSFILDDGTIEGHVGLNNSQGGGNESFAAVWVNRFSATDALTIDSISIYWPGPNTPTGDSGLLVGMQPNLVVYYDAAATGDVSNAIRIGGDMLVSVDVLDAPQTYTTAFSIPGAGDVYIGFVDQWALVDGGFEGIVFPAAIDQTPPSRGDSWVSGSSSTTLTDIVNLANNDLTGTIDSLGIAGNWMIRATGTTGGGGSPCSGPIVNWLTATPASGSVNGGANTNVAIVADPAAAGLAAGTYTAELCVTTNDPTQALIAIAVNLTVTAVAPTLCSGSDEIFCDGFDGTGGGSFTQPVMNPGFEATTTDAGTNPDWDSLDNNPQAGGTVFYSASGFGVPVRSGDFAAWFGGWFFSSAETQYFSQSVTLPGSGPLYLNYWRDVDSGADEPSSLMVVSVDGTAVEITDLYNIYDGAFVQQSIDIGAYADGVAHTIKFQYVYYGVPFPTIDGNTFIDDVTIDRTPTSSAKRFKR